MALDTHTKKMNPPSTILGGGGVHGEACWLTAYIDESKLIETLLNITVFNLPVLLVRSLLRTYRLQLLNTYNSVIGSMQFNVLLENIELHSNL